MRAAVGCTLLLTLLVVAGVADVTNSALKLTEDDWTADLRDKTKKLPKTKKQKANEISFPNLGPPVDYNMQDGLAVTNEAKGVFVPGWNGSSKIRAPKASKKLVEGLRYLATLKQVGKVLKKKAAATEQDALKNRAMIRKIEVRVNEIYDIMKESDPFRQVMDLKQKFEMVNEQVQHAYGKLEKVKKIEMMINKAKLTINFMEKKSVARVQRQMLKQKRLSDVITVAAANAAKIGDGVDSLSRKAGHIQRKVIGLEHKMESDRDRLNKIHTKTSTLADTQADYIKQLISEQQQHDSVIGDLDLKVSKMISGRASFEMRISTLMRNWQQRMLLAHKKLIDEEFRVQTLRLKSSLKQYENEIMDELEDFVSSRFNLKIGELEDVVRAEVRRELSAEYGDETTEEAETQHDLPKEDTLKEGWLFPKESPEQVAAAHKKREEKVSETIKKESAEGKVSASEATKAADTADAADTGEEGAGCPKSDKPTYELPNLGTGKKRCTCIDLQSTATMLLQEDESSGGKVSKGKISKSVGAKKATGDDPGDPNSILSEVDQELNLAETSSKNDGDDTAKVAGSLEDFENDTEGQDPPSKVPKPEKKDTMLSTLQGQINDPAAKKMICYCPDDDIDDLAGQPGAKDSGDATM